jgi:predicted nucleic acid-binding protein
VQIARSCQADPQLRYIWADEELSGRGFDLYAARLDKQWSLTDCVSFEVMRDMRLTDALASDHHFEQAGFRALLRQEPPT